MFKGQGLFEEGGRDIHLSTLSPNPLIIGSINTCYGAIKSEPKYLLRCGIFKVKTKKALLDNKIWYFIFAMIKVSNINCQDRVLNIFMLL